jgi:hypothetical protein
MSDNCIRIPRIFTVLAASMYVARREGAYVPRVLRVDGPSISSKF